MLVVAHFPHIWTRSIECQVSLIYFDKDHRGSVDALKSAVKTAEAYARVHGAAFVSVGSFALGSNRGVGAIWKRLGYREMSTTHVKAI